MSINNRKRATETTSVFASANELQELAAMEKAGWFESLKLDWKKKLLYPAAGIALIFLIGMGAMAKNGWLPSIDAMTGKKTGWFGKPLPANATSSWNPFASAQPLVAATPQLSKEYIYAGSRMLAVEDANANAAAPADLAVWRQSSGVWYIRDSKTGEMIAYQFGSPGDKPARGDYDADGKTDFSVYRPGSAAYWYTMTSSANQFLSTQFGTTNDIHVPADYDGDGKTDIAVFRPSTQFWHIYRSSDLTVQNIQFGTSTDTPVPADYDGDGRADVAQYRPATAEWFMLKSGSNNTFQAAQFGAANDKPVIGDYDGDGKYDFATWRSGDNKWRIRQSGTNTQIDILWGDMSQDTEVQGDFDADGKTDIAVWRYTGGSVGTWQIRNSSTGQTRIESWGTTGDIPVPAPYRRTN